MTKRIAIQFFGHLRTFQKTYKSFYKYVILPNQKAGYQVDIFMHTWNKTDHNDNTPWNNPGNKKRGKIVSNWVMDFINDTYKPKKILIEEQIPLTEQETLIGKQFGVFDKRQKNMFHTFSAVNELRKQYEIENNIKYDLIIVTRPDIIFYKKLSCEYIFRDLKQTEIDNTIFFMDIPLLDQKYCSINSRKFICGIDLLLISGNAAISCISPYWEKEYLKQPVPEKTIAETIYKNNIYLNLFQYPKHSCWNIKRQDSFLDKYLYKYIGYFFDIVTIILHPILLLSPVYMKCNFIDSNSVFYRNLKIKKIILRIIALFIPNKNLRHKIRSL